MMIFVFTLPEIDVALKESAFNSGKLNQFKLGQLKTCTFSMNIVPYPPKHSLLNVMRQTLSVLLLCGNPKM